jgi:DNA adenine methylase
LFFALSCRGRAPHARLNDLNRDLTGAYQTIKTNLSEVHDALCDIERRFREDPCQADFFYRVRSEQPGSNVSATARFIFLNKTCYNGLYRVNKAGKFNVPFGRHKNPTIFDANNMRSVSATLSGAEITAQPFQEALSRVSTGDFVYMDPPYQPISRTANFTGYTPERFTFEDQAALAREFHRLSSIGAFVMLSNSDHHAIGRLYGGKGYNIRAVKANRQINSDPLKRGKISELIVRNYD